MFAARQEVSLFSLFDSSVVVLLHGAKIITKTIILATSKRRMNQLTASRPLIQRYGVSSDYIIDPIKLVNIWH